MIGVLRLLKQFTEVMGGAAPAAKRILLIGLALIFATYTAAICIYISAGKLGNYYEMMLVYEMLPDLVRVLTIFTGLGAVIAELKGKPVVS